MQNVQLAYNTGVLGKTGTFGRESYKETKKAAVIAFIIHRTENHAVYVQNDYDDKYRFAGALWIMF